MGSLSLFIFVVLFIALGFGLGWILTAVVPTARLGIVLTVIWLLSVILGIVLPS